MSRDDVFRVRHNSIPAISDANAEQGILNRMGMQIVVDFFTQLCLSGFCYHMQIGTEDAPVASTTSIDDTLAWMVADNPAGSAMMPLLYEVNIGAFTTGTIAMSMLEADKDKVRYSSGGTAYAPANMRGDDLNAVAASSYYVGTDVTLAAKSAVPNTVELARRFHYEDVVTTTTGVENLTPTVYSVKTRPALVLVDAASLVCHHGCATADVTSYGVLQFAQFSKTLVV